jgi:hypothetical protein
MSVFSNPTIDAKDAAREYVRALLEVLGDRKPLDVLPNLVDDIQRAIEGVDRAVLERPEAPGKWSIVQVVQHLADTELVIGFRYRMILAQDKPPIPGFDQNLWADRLRYDHVRIEDALEQLGAIRQANLRVLTRLQPEEWERVGLHSERGPETVRRISELEAAHDIVHLRQIDRIKKHMSS